MNTDRRRTNNPCGRVAFQNLDFPSWALRRRGPSSRPGQQPARGANEVFSRGSDEAELTISRDRDIFPMVSREPVAAMSPASHRVCMTEWPGPLIGRRDRPPFSLPLLTGGKSDSVAVLARPGGRPHGCIRTRMSAADQRGYQIAAADGVANRASRSSPEAVRQRADMSSVWLSSGRYWFSTYFSHSLSTGREHMKVLCSLPPHCQPSPNHPVSVARPLTRSAGASCRVAGCVVMQF